MPEIIDEVASLESTTVGVYRTAATVKGGRRFSFSALVVVGDRAGRVGMGYGKANQVPPAIEKAQKGAKRQLRSYPLVGQTIPHAVTGRFGACSVRILPASPGTGVIAGAAVRAPLELVGIQDCLTKSFGSTNPKNLVKAVINGLDQLRSKQQIQSLRGVELPETDVEEFAKRGGSSQSLTTGAGAGVPGAASAQQERGGPKGRGGRGGGGGGRGRGGRGGGGGGRGRGPAPAPAPAEPAVAEAPPAEPAKPPAGDAPKSETPSSE